MKKIILPRNRKTFISQFDNVQKIKIASVPKKLKKIFCNYSFIINVLAK
jgi:hypothetical protein